MKKFFFQFAAWSLVAVLALPMAACSDDDDNTGGTLSDDQELAQNVLAAFVDGTAVPTYYSLAETCIAFRTAVKTFADNPSQSNLEAAASAWMTARVAWEMSEAFLVGPVGENNLGIDPHVDSWPLEIDDVETTLTGIQNNLNFTGADAWAKEGDVIGFHLTERLIYRDGTIRSLSDISEAERVYLSAASDALAWDAVLAYAAWVGESALSSEWSDVLSENAQVKAKLTANPYYTQYASKLKSASIYDGSYIAGLHEISTGCIDIAEEVGTTKIKSPYVGQSVVDVESWYSRHSLDDYTNNIESIKNAYLGGTGDNSRTTYSLSTYVQGKNAELDAQVKAKIEDCKTKIQAIGTGGLSFYEVVDQQINKTQVDEAVAACIELRDLFTQIEDQVL